VVVQTSPVVPVVALPSSGPPFALRAIYFIFIGSWLSGALVALAYTLALTVIGLPFAFMLFDLLPHALTLKPRTKRLTTENYNGIQIVRETTIRQRAFMLRALYFILIGGWLSLAWVTLAYFLALTILLLPLAMVMLNFTPQVMTLKRV
jgi:uncharacterized membrane protein YccF (DUF307 family)